MADQYCTNAVGLVDACVYAFKHQGHQGLGHEQFEQDMQGRFRHMTALTLAYAHAFQVHLHQRRHRALKQISAFGPEGAIQTPTMRTTTRFTEIDFNG